MYLYRLPTKVKYKIDQLRKKLVVWLYGTLALKKGTL
jgi:hypothetical protein